MAYHPVDVHVGQKVRKFREEKGLSQTQVAEKIGISFQQMQKYESGANRLSMSRTWEICQALKIAPSDLFEGYTNGRERAAKTDKTDGRADQQKILINRAFDEIKDPVARKQVLAIARLLAAKDAKQAKRRKAA